MGISRRLLGAQEEGVGIGRNQAGGHVSAGDRGWEGKGWRVTEPMGSRVIALESTKYAASFP